MFRHPKKRINYNMKLKLHGKRLHLSQRTKYLGVYFDSHLNWKTQCDEVAKKLRRSNGIISKLSYFLPLKIMVQTYHALFQSHINYGLNICAKNLPKNNRLQTKVSYSFDDLFSTTNCIPVIISSIKAVQNK